MKPSTQRVVFVAAFVVSPAQIASAQSPAPSVAIHDSASTCPSAREVHAVLAPLLPSFSVSIANSQASALAVHLADEGLRYTVTVEDKRRVFEDPARSCAERAKAAAVFLAVVLQAAPSPSPKPSPQPQPSLLPQPKPTPLPTRTPTLLPDASLEISGAIFGAPRRAPSNDLVSGGAQLRAYLGKRYFGATVGVSGLSPSDIDLSLGRVQVHRIPIDLDARAVLRRKSLELNVDVGLVFGILVMRGMVSSSATQGVRLELGVRFAIALKWWLHARWAPFVAICLEGVPRPQSIAVDPIGIIETTPSLWLSGAIGLAVRLH